MTYAGAAGKTADEMRSVLGFTIEDKDLHPAFGALLKALAGKKGVKLAVANALWGQKGLAFLKPFLGVTKKHYGGGFRTVDFKTKTAAAIKTINLWVEDKTGKKIKDLVDEKSVNTDTRLVLTNAIYFKGAWKEKFSKKETKDKTFHVSASKSVSAPTMHLRKKTLGLAKGTGFSALEMPYKGGGVSMVIVLPDKKDGLAEMEKGLTLDMLEDAVDSMKQTELDEVAVPRFKLEDKFELSKTLKAMGMATAFSSKADFSRMTEDEKLLISKVIHKTFCDVTEEGTEAAAATAVVMARGGAMAEPKTFIADHPFLFLIRDRATGLILFMGRITDPTA
jgi:serpin B